MRMHAGQLTVSTDAVGKLVAAQFPQWRELPVRAVVSRGTVNAIFRIGDDLVARFPLQPADAGSTRDVLEREATAARRILGRTPFRTPEPIAIGAPGTACPLPWAVQTWLPGTVATEQNTHGETFTGTNRGGDLRSHDVWMETCFQRSEALLDVGRLRRYRDTNPTVSALDRSTLSRIADGSPL